MSDSPTDAAAPPESSPPAPSSSAPQKRERAMQVVTDILEQMGLRARLESKDADDGGIALAVYAEEALPGTAVGRRSHVTDALQFIANKIVNRPGEDRRWIALGWGAYPEPRPPRGPRPPRPAAPGPIEGQPIRADPPPAGPRPVPPRAASNGLSGGGNVGPSAVGRPPNGARPPAKPVEADELTLVVSEDPALSSASRRLAERSAALGRYYGIAGMDAENRARILSGAAGVAGVRVIAEGEGRNRRVVFVPDKPSPMPKRSSPFGAEEDDEEEEL